MITKQIVTAEAVGEIMILIKTKNGGRHFDIEIQK